MSQFMSEDSVKANITFREMLRRLWPYNKRHLGLLTLVGLSVVILSIASRVLPTLIGYGIDHGILKNDRHVLIQVAIAYLLVRLIYTSCEFIFVYYFQVFGNRILYYIREDLILHVQRLPVQYFNKNPAGRIFTRLTNDIANLGELFSDSLVNVISQGFVIISIVIAMALISIKLMAATLFFAPLFIWLSYLLSEKIRLILRESKKRLSTMNSYVTENISGIKIVQLYNRVDKNHGRFSQLAGHYSETLLKSIRAYASMQPIMNFFNAVTISISLYYGGFLAHEDAIAIGSLVAFLIHTQDIVPPLSEILEQFQQLQNSLTSAERVFQLFDEVEETTRAESSFEIKSGKISIRNLTFQYESHLPNVLTKINLEINPGQSIAIVGRTGSGKTTLISLLQRFYPAPAQSIFIDSVAIESLDMQTLRRHIGVVQQENFIFHSTVRENVSLGDSKISEDMVVKACERVGYLQLLQQTGRNLDSVVEERGANLSVGERQLIAFARILAFQPEILILDEATANVDSATEKLIQSATREVTAGRTSILIAHRLSTIADCDKIVVMDQGQIIETGTHEELMANQNAYFYLASAGVKSIFTLDSVDGTAVP